MNTPILHPELQKFINDNLNTELSKLILKGIPFKDIDPKIVIAQIEAKKRCKKKLPTWFNTHNIYYPNKINIEQTSSEIAAQYKAKLISGTSLIDLTGGFGVDTYYFSKQVNTVIHCEINKELSKLVAHNFNILKAKNITAIPKDGIETLNTLNDSFDWIYIDPSRRDHTKQKVFLLSDCLPNVIEHQKTLFSYSKNIMLKTSPLLDISATIQELKHVKTLHIVAINNEVKELLWLLEHDYQNDFDIITSNITKTNIQNFSFLHREEALTTVTYSEVKHYLYEPNAAVLKAGAFNSLGASLKLNKIHKHAHLYTSDDFINFPGRCFRVEHVIPFNKKEFNKTGINKANVTTRHFPISVDTIRKKLKIKDGGNTYLFFTTDLNNNKIIIICSKLSV